MENTVHIESVGAGPVMIIRVPKHAGPQQIERVRAALEGLSIPGIHFIVLRGDVVVETMSEEELARVGLARVGQD